MKISRFVSRLGYGLWSVLVMLVVVVWVECGTGRAASDTSRNMQEPMWQMIGPGDATSVLDLSLDPNDSQRLYLASQVGLYRSLDGGSSWDPVLERFLRRVAVDPLDGDIVYTSPSFYKSIDGGDTWTEYSDGMSDNNLATLAVAKTDRDLLFSGSF